MWATVARRGGQLAVGGVAVGLGATLSREDTWLAYSQQQNKRERSYSSLAPTIVGYCTDVEGDFDFWNRYVSISQVLSRDTDSGLLELADGAHFVFGGDSVDWGSGDLEFLSELLDLHDRYAGRVHLIMGNRDINKIRFLQELSPAFVARYPLDQLPTPYWLSNRSPLEELQHFLGTEQVADTLPNRLHYILRYTMGCPLSFELRRAAIGNNADDDAVVDSFLGSMQPGGLMRGYLQRAKLGIVIGDTVFVHGGISPDTLGWLPPPLQTEPNAREWIEKLNMFAENQVQNLPSSDADDGDDGDVWDGGYAWSIEGGYTGRGADDLLQYGMRLSPTGWNNPGVVYNGFMKKDWTGAVDLSDDSYREVVDYLNRAGIFRVVCGHTPHGDAGLVVRTSRSDTEGGELTCITLDTSYSAQVLGMDIAPAETSPKQSPLTPKRHGVAVSELLLFREDDVGDEEKGLSHPRYKAVIHGVMVDGQLYEAHPDNSDAEIVAGDQVGQGWYVKGKRVRDGHIILSRNLPRSAERPYGAIENKYVSPVESISSLGQTLGD